MNEEMKDNGEREVGGSDGGADGGADGGFV
jgi:hypothetical protein